MPNIYYITLHIIAQHDILAWSLFITKIKLLKERGSIRKFEWERGKQQSQRTESTKGSIHEVRRRVISRPCSCRCRALSVKFPLITAIVSSRNFSRVRPGTGSSIVWNNGPSPREKNCELVSRWNSPFDYRLCRELFRRERERGERRINRLCLRNEPSIFISLIADIWWWRELNCRNFVTQTRWEIKFYFISK